MITTLFPHVYSPRSLLKRHACGRCLFARRMRHDGAALEKRNPARLDAYKIPLLSTGVHT
jgi:hypothetical protein